MMDRNADVSNEQRMDFRIGVNLGEVIIEGEDIHGDGVNVAARLEGLAEPGGICVSGKVVEEVRNKLEVSFEDMGAQEVKNLAEPVRVYRVVAGSDGAALRPEIFPISNKPSIAVLPFTNLSGDSEQEYFADGITEDIITALSRWRSIPVIARNSTFVYKGQLVDIRKIGEELKVPYVLEGSVRKGGNRVRIAAQLIDAKTNQHMWGRTV